MSETRTITMKTNFEGLIRLLADGLYSTSDIFVRELIQNGHDSIVRREALKESFYQGEISITYDSSEKSITFADNGIGMDESDIENFLSVIGSTGTGISKGELEDMFSEELIGQFGIGMLSSFLVASKVCVQTHKVNSDTAYQWVNYGSTECELSLIDRKEVGTAVTVFVRPDFTYLLDRQKLEEIIRRYCDFISVPVKINGTGPVNAIFAPWDKEYQTAEQEMDTYSTFVNRRFPDMSMDVFPININKQVEGKDYRAQGVLYISNQHLAGLNSTGTLDIFVRKMLVKEGDTSLLPTWAKFVRGVVDSPDLSPTAGRDNINQENTAFKVIQAELGVKIIERLEYLAENRLDKFSYINQWHHDHLKGMAMVNEDFFSQVADLLLFETNQGDVSLQRYIPMNPLIEGRNPIYYFSHYDSAAQYYRMANEKGLVVINAGRNYDEELLEKYGEHHPEVTLEKLNVLDKGIFFDELSAEERLQFRRLEERMSYHLNHDLGLNIVLNTKLYAPKAVPAVIIETEVSKTDRELQDLLNTPSLRMNFGDAFRSIQERIHNRPVQLALNGRNTLIQLLSKANLDSVVTSTVMTLLYNNALIYSHRLDERNMSIVHDNVAQIMTMLIETQHENLDLRDELLKLRKDMQVKNASNIVNGSKHILMFMITPFADEYRSVELAVRRVFEQAPFCFEVCLARDKYNADTLVENVKSHIAAAQCFIAEISDLNPNVMMEVGGILMSGDKRPVFALWDTHSTLRKPADFGDRLTFSYSGRSSSPDELVNEITSHLIEGGRIKNARIEELIRRRKELYLSHTLLSGLTEIHLNDSQRASICNKFKTVDSYVSAKEDVLSTLGVNMHILLGLQDELKKVMEECRRYEG
ncbi:ATP-binding protein [Oscillospiraceae bacterium CLA-AA-H272]|jgi:Molecular chaperone, HSP90 family|uniref:ATP-binding protein n=1 Tax=Brotocaccenecus cirricatena TaxID=3064195 RepID=A0AAE3AIC5_9FIRM|nr:ATP-binding protein [Brotocaccenecus cirricatena]MCC2130586.1 ATP-binding protein [Brotocaccenecus cirricatena]